MHHNGLTLVESLSHERGLCFSQVKFIYFFNSRLQKTAKLHTQDYAIKYTSQNYTIKATTKYTKKKR